MSRDDAPFPSSLCHRCRHRRLVRARSVFILCAAPELPRYPPQPVEHCGGFAGAEE